jgi:protein PhnA
MSDALTQALLERSSKCELCESEDDLGPLPVPPDGTTPDTSVLACATCRGQVEGGSELDPKHWFCLQGAVWSEVPAVKVVSWRMLQRLSGEGWAIDLLDQAYLDEETLAWAQQGESSSGEASATKTVDSNGTELGDGDSVTLIKDLPVKGANFTAKRGTLVKNIRLSEDPGLVEGRVNKVTIFLKTEFLRKA